MSCKLEHSSIFYPLVSKVILCALLFVSMFSAKAQKEHPVKVDLEQLRGKLESAVGKDLEVGKTELKTRSNLSGGGSYWLAHLKPRHPGQFTLSYRYKYSDPHYSHVERTFNFNVGRKGCGRGVPRYGNYHRYCLGDTIILPVAINKFTEHDFTLKSTAHTREQDEVWERIPSESADKRLDLAPVTNPLADNLRYLGSTNHKLLHRSGGYTLEAYAVFEAVKPGRFNLALSAAFPDLPSAILSSTGGSEGVPIIIVPRGTPVTLLASSHGVNGYTKGYDGREYVSSTSGDSYMTEVTIMVPGDRISLKYFTAVRRASFERNEMAGRTALEVIPPPLISQNPFELKSEYYFTEWLVDYLPR